MRGYFEVEESYYFMPDYKYALKSRDQKYAQGAHFNREWETAWRDIDVL